METLLEPVESRLLETGSVLCRKALWEWKFGGRIWIQFPAQLLNNQYATLKARRELGRVNSRKDFWNFY